MACGDSLREGVSELAWAGTAALHSQEEGESWQLGQTLNPPPGFWQPVRSGIL